MSCILAMASAVSGCTGSFGALENSMLVTALPWVKYTSVMAFERLATCRWR